MLERVDVRVQRGADAVHGEEGVQVARHVVGRVAHAVLRQRARRQAAQARAQRRAHQRLRGACRSDCKVYVSNVY